LTDRSIDRRPERETALVLHPVRPKDAKLREPAARLQEAVGLAEALDLDILAAEVAPIRAIVPATLFGKGKVEEFRILIEAKGLAVVVVDDQLSPVQQRNLEKAWNAKVVDRTGLILEIFARRARTGEGKLQVELARLEYERSRLVRTWTHLERQAGGTGKTGGPGETQIELDRRQIADRIVKLKRELDEVRRTRTLHRTQRRKVPHPTVALVGYTNAGKSTLFNRLTHSAVMAEDMLFATLDPTLRTVNLPNGRPAILSDTVGFISDLPTELVEAFRATLEEVQEADVILHVRDVANEDTEAQAADVQAVLSKLEADAEHGRTSWRSGTSWICWPSKSATRSWPGRSAPGTAAVPARSRFPPSPVKAPRRCWRWWRPWSTPPRRSRFARRRGRAGRSPGSTSTAASPAAPTRRTAASA
jgi:GTP-binding protein HflX